MSVEVIYENDISGDNNGLSSSSPDISEVRKLRFS